ncbi:hypothetical protein ACQKGL_24745 [Ensifer adhaerens]|uniref:hypothetical protein n=1 Tax=Ensifer adhaerens TaxID=106592 RepID=UPI003D00295D
MLKRRSLPMLGALATALPALRVANADAAENGLDAEEARAIAKDAYIYGFPLVDNYRIQHSYFVDRSNPEYKSGWNTLNNTARVYTPEALTHEAFTRRMPTTPMRSTTSPPRRATTAAFRSSSAAAMARSPAACLSSMAGTTRCGSTGHARRSSTAPGTSRAATGELSFPRREAASGDRMHGVQG